MCQPDMGKSYINITKGVNGGTVEPGDTLEIRASFVVKAGFYDSCAYVDVVLRELYTYPVLSACLPTRDYLQQFTDAIGDDCGWLNPQTRYVSTWVIAPPMRRQPPAGGKGEKYAQTFFLRQYLYHGGSYRVRVIAPLGNIINTGGGSFSTAPAAPRLILPPGE